VSHKVVLDHTTHTYIGRVDHISDASLYKVHSCARVVLGHVKVVEAVLSDSSVDDSRHGSVLGDKVI